MNSKGNMERDLSGLRGEFAEGFEQKVMQAIAKSDLRKDAIVTMWSRRFLYGAAACLAFLLITTYVGAGSFSSDAFIGLEGFDSIDLTESLDTYSNIYHE